MHVWNVLHAAHWKYRTQKIGKKCHLGTITELCPAISLQLRHVSTIGKNLLNSNNSSTCPHNMVNFGPLTAEIFWRVWGTLANFNRFRILASLVHQRCSTEVNKTLQDVWTSPGLVHYIYIFRGSSPNGILPVADKNHFASKSCILIYWQHYCTALEQQPSAKLGGVVQGMELWNFAEGAAYVRLGGHHVGHQPTL